jgi:hypothetical protein
MSPTQRSLELLRELGYTPDVVERRIPGADTTRDFFGCIDLIAAHPRGGILAVQATTSSNLAARVAKAKAERRLAVWLRAGGKFEAWGWSERGARGRVKVWAVRRVRASLAPDGSVGFVELTSHPAIGAPGALPIGGAM